MSIRPLGGLLTGVSLALLLSLTLSLQTSAVCGGGDLSDYCSDNHGLVGQLSSIEGRSSVPGAEYPAVERPDLPPAGSLTHADHLLVEAEAKSLLEANKQFRKSISPHSGDEAPNFDELVQRFDYESGFDRTIPGESVSIQQRIDRADQELRRARDLYAFLAVYATETRFRGDRAYCDAQPQADDPVADPPVVDWCNFAARMRETVREVAYLRMIFGQQFTADALGLHFSGTEIVGGEAYVIDEVRKLELALEQYEAAEAAVFEGLMRAIGDGCYVSDFYSQSEWALTSRAVDGKERALHHIAVRKSYLDAYGPEEAQADYRDATVDQYVNLIGIAGISGRSAEGCARGTNPDSAMLAEIVLRMADTQQTSRTLSQGRNIFGYDVQFTPARPYRTSFGSDDRGILHEAKEAAKFAKDLQSDEEAATRIFDQKASDLMAAIQSLKSGRDERIQALAGCDRSDPQFSDDESYFACVQETIDTLESCDPTMPSSAAFEACVQQAPVSDMRQSRQELRAVYLQYLRVQTEYDNILERANAEEIRNSTVKNSLVAAARESSALEAAITLASCCTIDFPDLSVSFSMFGNLEAGLRAGQIMRQAAHDMDIEDAEKEAVIRNLFLDQAELQVDIEITLQEYQAKLTEYQGIRDQTKHEVIEARRDRAYLQNSPANDPSYRLVRDSKRLTLASQLEYASRVSYLAARRAEYEYAARLNASGIRISDIYRARTADDIQRFLQQLEAATDNLIVEDAEINQEDFRLSVAQHVLGLSDDFLGLSGDAARAERVRRFRDWVARNTSTGGDGKPMLQFSFTTSLEENGVFSSVIQQGFDRFWLFQLSGIGQPKAGNTGMGMNLVTEQSGDLGHRRVVVTQAGVAHLRSRAGCIFDYRLIHPAALVGQEWPSNQPPEQATTDFKSNVNGAEGERTGAFLSRPVSASSWEVQVFAGAPEIGLDDLDLQQLEDIELSFSTTRGSRTPGQPQPEDCVRGDF